MPSTQDAGGASDSVFAWLACLDDLTYYELFGIPQGATPDEVRAAFHVFCDVFHPDRHLGRPAEERDAVSSIFKRGTEGYLVLSDLGFRDRYDAQISTEQRVPGGASPSARLPDTHGMRRGLSNRPPPRLEDAARTPSARPFARRAEELLQRGELRQAKLQLVMANHKDPANDELEAALRDLEAKMAAMADAKGESSGSK
jgi:curved DNA-binding protein CbpA